MFFLYNVCSYVKGMVVLVLFLFLIFYYIMVNKCWIWCFLVVKLMRNIEFLLIMKLNSLKILEYIK